MYEPVAFCAACVLLRQKTTQVVVNLQFLTLSDDTV